VLFRSIAASHAPVAVLARRYGVSELTIRKWRSRDSVFDRPHTAHRLQTTLTPAQEAIAVALRRTLLLPLDDLLAVVREFLAPDVSRSGLDRCLRRHGVGRLADLTPRPAAPPHAAFKAYEPGFVHVDVKYLPQLPDEDTRRYLFVAIDRATRWVFVQVKPNKTARGAAAFLKALHTACPIPIRRVLTDNGKEFTDRFVTAGERTPPGQHVFDQLCEALGIEHRLTRPRRPQTNGMVERFNGRIADVLRTHRFRDGEDLTHTLLRYATLYNQDFPQAALGGKTPLQAMQQWYHDRPDLFHQRPYDHAGFDS
jgi:transposase InsO family protein